MDKTQRKIREKHLFEAILKLKDMEECRLFFADLCTFAELEALSDRWTVAQLLDEEMPYRAISEKTGICTATVTRVARSLEYGEGYQMLLKKMKRRTKNAGK
jgi:TrpR-related protein YerC/YecD